MPTQPTHDRPLTTERRDRASTAEAHEDTMPRTTTKAAPKKRTRRTPAPAPPAEGAKRIGRPPLETTPAEGKRLARTRLDEPTWARYHAAIEKSGMPQERFHRLALEAAIERVERGELVKP
jgi:hypothetical protein